jgi:hypothetical protein
VIWYENALPTIPFAVVALVIAGAWITVSVNACTAFGVTPFCAVKVIG